MKKGLLLCSGGMSTTIIAKGLNDIFKAKMKWDADGVAQSSSYQDKLSEYDFVFVSPQIRFMFDDINMYCEMENVPCEQIPPQLYIVTKVKELADLVREKIQDV